MELIELTGKIVEVGTTETSYIGKLIEVNENEVHIESETGWIVVPMDRVAFIREAEQE